LFRALGCGQSRRVFFKSLEADALAVSPGCFLHRPEGIRGAARLDERTREQMTKPHTSGYFLAVDAGGTKTDLLLADANGELARVRTGSIKLLNTPRATAEGNLRRGWEELEAGTGVSLGAVTRTCVGTSGYSVPLVVDWIRAQFREKVGGELLLCGDEEIALDAAFEGRWGVLVLAGTGSNAMGRNLSGRTFSAGGWGPVLADEGSGHWIGLEALRAALRARDEGRATCLLDAIGGAWGVAGLREVVERGNSAPPPPFAELTPIIVRCAEEGDEVAAKVLERAGEELARLADLVLRQMRTEDEAAFAAPSLAVAGSILENVAPVRERLCAMVGRAWPGVALSSTRVDPILGALWRARRG
jgi:glucosamine kinase